MFVPDCQIAKSEQKQGADDRKRDVSCDGLTLYHNRRDNSANSDNKHQVKNIRADYVADGKFIIMCQRCGHADCCFRQGCSHCYDRKSDNDRRDF